MKDIINRQTTKSPSRAEPSKLGFKKIIIFSLTLILLVLGFVIFTAVKDRGTYQAVFLTNDQVYFGHLSYWPLRSTATLSDIYYLRAANPLQPQEQNQDQLNMELVKFGKEAHGPEDKMVIPKNQILFWEDLRDDSRVVQTILEHKRQKK